MIKSAFCHFQKIVAQNRVIVYFIIFIIIGALLYQKHKDVVDYDWKNEIYADQSGYFMYLPALFIYQFDANKMPKDIENKVGHGFQIDSSTRKIIDKYTCGVAILQAPFFIFCHYLTKLIHLPLDGFSNLYRQVPNFASWFYTLLALLFLFKFIRFYFSWNITFVTILSLFLGTNWYYYSIDSTGMSHNYSLCLLAIILYLSKRYGINGSGNWIFCVISLLAALICLIRPLNVVALPLVFILSLDKPANFIAEIKKLFSINRLTILALSFLIIWFPQMLYWKYSYGSWITYSYKDEGFSNALHPKLLELWFAPDNGLFLYNPLYIFILTGIILMLRKKLFIGFSVAVLFSVVSYLCASWHLVSFGCSFGQRSFVDFMPLWSIPLAYFVSNALSFTLVRKSILGVLFGLFIVFNLIYIYSFEKCFFGNTWDYKEFLYYESNNWHTENATDIAEKEINSSIETKEIIHTERQTQLFKHKSAKIEFELYRLSDSLTSDLIFEVLRNDSIIYKESQPFAGVWEPKQQWLIRKYDFQIHNESDGQIKYQTKVCNKYKRDSFKIKNVSLEVH